MMICIVTASHSTGGQVHYLVTKLGECVTMISALHDNIFCRRFAWFCDARQNITEFDNLWRTRNGSSLQIFYDTHSMMTGMMPYFCHNVSSMKKIKVSMMLSIHHRTFYGCKYHKICCRFRIFEVALLIFKQYPSTQTM